MLVTMRWRHALLIIGLVAVLGAAAWWGSRASAQGEPPMAPVVYSGSVTVAGQAAPDGLQIVGRIADYDSTGRALPLFFSDS